MAVLTRYVGGDVARASVLALLVLVAMLLSNRFAALAARVAAGELPADVLGTLLLLKVLKTLPAILPAAFFVAAMAVLGRLYRDSEITAMLACGVPPARIYRGVLAVALPAAGLVLVVAGWAAPWAETAAERMEREAELRAEASAFEAGRFRSSEDGRVTFYAERISPDRRRFEAVFAEVRGPEGRTVLRARWAERVTLPDGERHLILHDGVRYEGEPGRRDWRLLRFAAHGLRVAEPRLDPGAVERARDLGELLADGAPAARAELHWRLALALAIPVLGVVALPLARTDPRRGRAWPLLAALVLYLVYFNLLLAGRSWLEGGRVPAALGLWWVHGAALLLWAGLALRPLRGRR
ncbi:LPS export ABC transporter permease LptF [Inmirania thermothiophila]|uniref:Lipopolysaccharide export system permease protein LptF n=1 Tax=Inmirania thermothiophila TaxID=1750597 RepID=A0A3N1Y252_9GAMM|nr:LPS export ABC transporter permease LptF [Inmirania thermothiophila]ROR32890.1 lipopolysaccharide export system permease protein [Inmirania thermothiophila]